MNRIPLRPFTVAPPLALLLIAMLPALQAYDIEPDNSIIYVNPAPFEKNPTNRLAEAQSVTPHTWNWNSGNQLGWQATGITNLTVSNGAISGTGSTASPYLNISNYDGPDLDFGFYDFLQIRMRLPQGYTGDVIFRFGTSQNSGNGSATREFRIPNKHLNTAGNWETYRIDLGLIVWWRDKLSSLRIYPLGANGQGLSFDIDYIEIGDKPGDLLLVNNNLNFAAGESIANVQSMQSKHAVFWWSPQSYAVDNRLNPEVHGRRALRMIEESYQVFHKVLGYKDPSESWDLWRRNGNRYKTNHTTWYGGFWMGGHAGFGYFNVPAGGLFDEGWGNPVPHELAHVFQGHQINFLAGGHWESHANYLRQAWQIHYAARFPTNQQAQLSLNSLINSNFRQDHGGLIYQDFRIHHAIESLTDEGLNPYLAAQIWYDGTKSATVYDTLANFLPQGKSVQNIVGKGMRHWPLLDFKQSAHFQNQLWDTARNKAWHNYATGSLLIPNQDRPGWWRVPIARAPERFAYMYHELDVNSSSVTVELEGINVMGNTEGWRWTLAALHNNGSVRYSNTFAPGTQTMALQSGESKVYVIVVATPTDTSLNLEWAGNRFRTDKHMDRLRYPYELRIVGATPAKRQLNWNTNSGSAHSNGGGWVANSATVAPSAYVGPNARVLGSAQVSNNARIEDYAVVAEQARVENNAVVSGYAVVRGNSRVRDNARIRDRAIITDTVQVTGNAVVTEYARPTGNTTFSQNAIARGQAEPWTGNLNGHAILDYDYSMAESLSTGVHTSHVPWGDWYIPYYVETQAKPRGLVASYRAKEPSGQLLWDEFGTVHALLRGNVQRVHDNVLNTNVLRLNGTNAYAVLDRNLATMRAATYSMWVKPQGANTSRSALYMGDSANSYFRIIPRDANGKVRVQFNTPGSTSEFISNSTTPQNKWTHIAITINTNRQANLYINGQLEASGTSALFPEQVMGSNDYTSGEALYLGRDWNGQLFTGDIVDLRVHNVALSASEIAAQLLRTGDCIGAIFINSPTPFNGSTTEFQSGVRDGLVRTLQANIFPQSFSSNNYYQAVFDSSDENNSNLRGSGFGLRNSRIYVRLANVGFWDTGVNATLNQWQTIKLAYDGKKATLFVNNKEVASRNYNANESHLVGKNFRIGFAQSAAAGKPKYYFHGEIADVFIFDNLPGEEPESSINDWRMTHFGTTANTGDFANNADFDKDGFSNLMEYALGTNPTIPSQALNALSYGFTEKTSTAPFSVNFYTASSSSPALAPGDTTGVIQMNNWNNITSNNPNTGNIHDSNGNAITGINITGIGTSDTWNRNNNITDRMLSDFINTGNGSSLPRLTISGLEGTTYNLYLYTQPFGNTDMTITVNNTTKLVQKKQADVGSFVENSTYTVWNNLKGNTSLTIDSTTAGSGISGFQIIPTEGGEQFLTLTFNHIDDPALTYAIEATNSLSEAWSIVHTFPTFTSVDTITYIDNINVNSVPARFIRLVVTIDED